MTEGQSLEASVGWHLLLHSPHPSSFEAPAGHLSFGKLRMMGEGCSVVIPQLAGKPARSSP
ncbi:hypothetical protein [Agrobacterium rosae]|uniref:Uncharacterized protein n=1 Tax=Agrobacterium rosae TaxID=1972867 RepID=A0AAW9F8N8_9HYPH|nr:hypothetical protein [Agrobacterium rosae]MDX8301551.1 hypothetical protein [Agrobacterium rosae]